MFYDILLSWCQKCFVTKKQTYILIHNHCEWIIIFSFFEMLSTYKTQFLKKFSKTLQQNTYCNMSNGFIGGCTLLCLSFNVGTWYSFYGFGKNRRRTSASSASCREMPVVAISRISAILVRIFSIRLPATSAPTLNK